MSVTQQLFKTSIVGLVSLLMLLLMTTPASAVQVQGLYTAKAEVVDQLAETRREALPALMTEVLGRVVGEPDAEILLQRWPSAQSEVKNAERYLAQFLYQRVNVGPDSEGQLILRAKFEPSAIERVVQRLAMPQWGADRPELLVVLAWQGEGKRAVLASSPSSQIEAELSDELENVANSAGLPIALPLMDLQDQRHLSEQELRAGFTDGLLDVASRYGADAVLFGRARVMNAAAVVDGEPVPPFSSRNAEMSWSLHQRGQATSYADSTSSVEGGYQAGLWMAARSLAQRYAIQAGAAGDEQLVESSSDLATVNVLGVSSLVDLKRVEKHLAERTIVANAALNSVASQGNDALAVFTLSLKGPVAKLEQALAVGRLLSPTPKPVNEPEVNQTGFNADAAVVDAAQESALPQGQEGFEGFAGSEDSAQADSVPELWYRLR